MKTIDMRSLLAGTLLGASIILTIASATSIGSRVVWEYKVVSASVFQDELGKAINSSVADGWAFVSASGPNEGNWGFAVLKREKK